MTFDFLKSAPTIKALSRRAKKSDLIIPQELFEPDIHFRRFKSSYTVDFASCRPVVLLEHLDWFMRYFNAIAQQINQTYLDGNGLLAEAELNDGVAKLWVQVGSITILVTVRASWRSDNGHLCLTVSANRVLMTMDTLRLLQRTAIAIWLMYVGNGRYERLARLRVYRHQFKPNLTSNATLAGLIFDTK